LIAGKKSQIKGGLDCPPNSIIFHGMSDPGEEERYATLLILPLAPHSDDGVED
jgi:hypothetical protein